MVVLITEWFGSTFCKNIVIFLNNSNYNNNNRRKKKEDIEYLVFLLQQFGKSVN